MDWPAFGCSACTAGMHRWAKEQKRLSHAHLSRHYFFIFWRPQIIPQMQAGNKLTKVSQRPFCLQFLYWKLYQCSSILRNCVDTRNKKAHAQIRTWTVLFSWNRMSLLPNEIIAMSASCLYAGTNIQSCRWQEDWIIAQIRGVRVLVGNGLGPQEIVEDFMQVGLLEPALHD